MREGSRILLLGPCGSGFSPPDGVRNALLVAGGMGVAPLAYLAEKLARMGSGVTLLYGTKSAEQQVVLDWLEACGVKVERCTDDGSAGHHGTVLSLAEKRLGASAQAEPVAQYIAACGPEVMLSHLWSMVACLEQPKVEFALENRMACGVGACLGCTIELASGKRARVCREGPVFEAREVYGR
ncbi:MAG: hypothetical protein D6806_02375 [Deltaproteobacteria bacterium]|nr:MAG: hypothetical protein D6806_02375 [Deltaproteobacteria bacterium]